MDIFDYLAEEDKDIENKLKEVTDNYTRWSRERVFDRVKLIGDEIMGHVKKQDHLLIEHVEKTYSTAKWLRESAKDRMAVEDELGQLVMVHVDEPNYEECLAQLLKVVRDHVVFSRRLFAALRVEIPKAEQDSMNTQLMDVVLHSADYNSIQSQ